VVNGQPTGGFDGANGDMGENDTAGLGPVFYFHHCFIDYAFWTWQRRHDSTQALEIDPHDPGAGYSTSNPPPAGRQPDERLDVNSALNPFRATNGAPMTSADVTDIARLGYSYGPGSLDRFATAQLAAMVEGDPADGATRSVHVEGLDRSKLRGSFMISGHLLRRRSPSRFASPIVPRLVGLRREGADGQRRGPGPMLAP
jgi:tyrosinase